MEYSVEIAVSVVDLTIQLLRRQNSSSESSHSLHVLSTCPVFPPFSLLGVHNVSKPLKAAILEDSTEKLFEICVSACAIVLLSTLQRTS
jgi:hypothetical protein